MEHFRKATEAPVVVAVLNAAAKNKTPSLTETPKKYKRMTLSDAEAAAIMVGLVLIVSKSLLLLLDCVSDCVQLGGAL